MTRVVVADDQTVVREGIVMLLGLLPGIEVVGAAADGEEAVRLVADLRPEVVLMDLRMPRCDGVEATRRIRAEYPATQVVVLTTYADDDSLFPALRAGARGYVTKEQTTVEIMHAIRTVLAGKIFLNPGMADHFLHRIGRSAAPAPSQVESLSDRELEIFSKIGQGRGTRDIASELHLSVKTVGTYRENIKAKLNLRTGSDLVRHAVEWLREQSQGGPVG